MLRFELDFDIFSFWEVIIREMFKIESFTLKNDPESISNDSRMSPESFRSNFHIIFDLQDPKTVDFQLKFIKQFKSMPEIWQGHGSPLRGPQCVP